MRPIYSSKAVVTGLTILVLFGVGAFAASISNSTEMESQEGERRRCPDWSKGECLQVGLYCSDVIFAEDDCCCRFEYCIIPILTLSEWCYPGGLHIPFVFKNGTTEVVAIGSA